MVNLDLAAVEDFSGFRDLVRSHSAALSAQLQAYQTKVFPPHARKTIRNFSPAEAEKIAAAAPDATAASLEQSNLLLQRRVEALQNSEQNLKQRLNQTTVLLDQERRRNSTLKGA